jgi:V/A-type H+-transporting ATPase subunit E
MDIQLQELVDKIKKDGVEAADAKAADIVAAAKASAEAILREARAEAESIVAKAKAEAARSEQASISAIGQAGRNLLIEFRDGLVSELSALVRSGTAKAYDADVLKKLVPETVRAWVTKGDSDDIAVILSPADAERLEAELKSALKDEIAKGLEIRGNKSVSGGFRIAMKDGSAYYDFSAEAVANLFSAYLSPRVSEILKSAAKES